ncbi:hypothetical protein KUF83_30215 [Streptomyces sp. BV286]|uniref:hypothetical protein n=1 Tax=Streptomyces sp. BV286 TaxID=2849672 RepID=UPI001C2E163D|nr:hypothetical protein [Streptomyces sp. BV286]MBV1940812.1 hypothetical protein [Streptomyces sp. BV286]
MIDLFPAAANLLRAIVNSPNGTDFDPVRGGRLRMHDIDMQPNRSTLTTLVDSGLVDSVGSRVRATAAGRQWVAVHFDGAPRTHTHDGLRALLIAGQSAVRAVENRSSRRVLSDVDKALCALPLLDMDDQAYNIVQGAIRAVGRAEDSETWALLSEAEHGLSLWLHLPTPKGSGTDAIMAVATLAVHCARTRDWGTEGDAERTARYRAYQAGVEALSAIVSAVHGDTDVRRKLDKAMTTFFDAVRRAISYEALYEVRRALVEFARSYGLFVIGMRQPQPSDTSWEWERRIGDSVFLFRVDPPMFDGDPYGSVAVQRVGGVGWGDRVRYFPLSSDEKRRAAVDAARYRI